MWFVTNDTIGSLFAGLLGKHNDMVDDQKLISMQLCDLPTPCSAASAANCLNCLEEGQSKRGGQQSRLGAQESKLGDQQGRLEAQESKLGDEQSRLGAQESKLGEQQSILGAQESKLGDH